MGDAEDRKRVCPGCGADIVPANIVDAEDGSVTFDCVACGIGLQDNPTRTALRLSKTAAKKAKAKGK